MTTKPSSTKVVSMFFICCCDRSDTYEHLLASIAETEEPEKEVRSLFLPCAPWSATMTGVQQISAMEIIGTNEDCRGLRSCTQNTPLYARMRTFFS